MLVLLDVKPRKLHNDCKRLNVTASTFIAWTAVVTSAYMVFSGPQSEGVNIPVPRFSFLITVITKLNNKRPFCGTEKGKLKLLLL